MIFDKIRFASADSSPERALRLRGGSTCPNSTLGDQLGASVDTLRPLHESHRELRARWAERLHADDTTVADPGEGQDHDRAIWTYCARRTSPSAGGRTGRFVLQPRRTATAITRRHHLARWLGIPPGPTLMPATTPSPTAIRKPAPVTNALVVGPSRRKFIPSSPKIARRARSRREARAISPIALQAVRGDRRDLSDIGTGIVASRPTSGTRSDENGSRRSSKSCAPRMSEGAAPSSRPNGAGRQAWLHAFVR